DHYNAVSKSGISRDELIRAGGLLREYFNNGDDRVSVRVVRGDQDIPLFNDREIGHLHDVKSRFHTQNMVQELSVLYLLAYIAIVVLWSREVSPKGLAVRLMAGGALTILLVGVAGAFTLGGFAHAWFRFHEIIFTTNFWKLNPRTDHLIQMFPPAF